MPTFLAIYGSGGPDALHPIAGFLHRSDTTMIGDFSGQGWRLAEPLLERATEIAKAGKSRSFGDFLQGARRMKQLTPGRLEPHSMIKFGWPLAQFDLEKPFELAFRDSNDFGKARDLDRRRKMFFHQCDARR